MPSTLLCSTAPGNDPCPTDSPAPGPDLRLPSTLLCSTAPVTTPARLTLPLLVSPLVRPWFSLVLQPAGCLRLPACLGASSLRWWILTCSSEPLTFSHFPQPLNKLYSRLRNWVSLSVCPVPVTERTDHNMDPADLAMNLDQSPEPPSALQRLELSERELGRVSGDVASLMGTTEQIRQLVLFLQQQGTKQAQQLDQISAFVTSLGVGDPKAPSAGHSAPSSSPSSVPLAAGGPEPRIGLPERFGGDPEEVIAYITNCQLTFDLQPWNFSSQATRVAFAINLLTGRARLWGTAEYQRQSPACRSFDAFAAELLKVFGAGTRATDASCELMEIRQGKRTVADFSIDFRTIASKSHWNTEALVDAYLHSLADYIKDELVAHETPATLDEAIALTIRIDRRVQARRREKGRSSQPPRRSSDGGSSSSSRFASTRQASMEPMEVDRTSLSLAERQRRLTGGLCLYCGGEGHRVSACPVKRSSSPEVGNIRLSSTSMSAPRGNRPLLRVALQLPSLSRSLTALIDSGSEANILDITLAQQMGLEFHRLPSPVPARALDGHLLGQITHISEAVGMLSPGEDPLSPPLFSQ
ncbi:hypothetical protein ACEWY4_021323 [Coilia grayii]|uniref:Retrotransposon gag domain-containing protein n=1 Tax=Coilia grayii TaxID=363190 RepID=A0ABD1JB61_9TELE